VKMAFTIHFHIYWWFLFLIPQPESGLLRVDQTAGALMSLGYVVFPDPVDGIHTHVDATLADANVSSAASFSAATETNHSSESLIRARLQSLLAHVNRAKVAAVADALAEALEADVGSETAMFAMSADAEPGVTVFESAGAFLVTHLARGERQRLRESGLHVVPNRRVFKSPRRKGIVFPSLEAAGVHNGPWHLPAIGVAAMHNQGVHGQGQMIGILDTGIDPSHPEFNGKHIEYAHFDELGQMTNAGPRDFGDHGTHVAALAAGVNVGVAPKASLAVAAVLTHPTRRGLSGTIAQILGGMNWLARLDPPNGDLLTVVNASLGGAANQDYLFSAVQTAQQLGIAFVAAIGNDGRLGANSHGSPGDYDISIGVGAVDPQQNVAPFSAWGQAGLDGSVRKPDLCAPGTDIISAVPGGQYMAMSGTSMAAPIVVGSIALIRQSTGYDMEVDALEQLLCSSYVTQVAPGSAQRAGRGLLVFQ
jgi:hypothetical protein